MIARALLHCRRALDGSRDGRRAVFVRLAAVAPFAFAALLLGGCAAVAPPESVAWDAAAGESAVAAGRGVLASFGETEGAAAEGETQAPGAERRLMIYSARFEILVANVKDSIERFQRRVIEAGGYLQSLQDETITCRVPARRFDEVVAAVPSFGTVLGESIQAQDVTRAHLELGLRIAAAETAHARLLALLERAEKVEDVLAIEKELRRLTEEIERMKAELVSLDSRIAYSTVEVRFRSAAPEPRPVPRNRRSRFAWINRVGVEHVLEAF